MWESSSVTSIIAHRGASKVELENTLAAFRRAVTMGAHAVELDVRRTRDGVLVVHHNPTLADGRVIAQSDHRDLPDHVPTLDEALDACNPLWVNVEIKNDSSEPDFDANDTIADDTIALLARRAEGDRAWLISSFRRETIDRCRALRPTIRTAWLTVTIDADAMSGIVNDLAAAGHTALHPWHGTLTRDLIQRCHAVGLDVNTWTCDDAERMSELMVWEIDGICTNVPDVGLSRL
ncbi:MAG: hypothetical protein B7C54_04830 [Acidimicrobiales bacterium mtb01]|nr:MAG: hypothetical protein B7C54_04830 [Acidimicrobiales bacterium mtb01]